MQLTRIAAAVGALSIVALGPLATSAGASTGHAVTMANYAFSPASITVHVGDTITWTNTDQAPHDVTTTSGPVSIHSSMLMKGQSWQYSFTTAGTYSYICSIHPDMRATVVVKPAAAPSTPHTTHAVAPKTQSPAIPPTHPAPTTSSASSASTSSSSTAVAAPLPATSSAAPVASSSSTPTAGKLKPLLIVAGLVAAVATFCLLVLASRPDNSATPSAPTIS